MRFLLLEGIHDIAYKKLNAENLKVEQIKGVLSETDIRFGQITGLGIRSRTKVTKNLLLSLSPSLKVIGAFCIGTDQVDLKAAHQLGVPVFNAPYGNTRSVAELVIGAIIALSRRSHVFNQMMHQRKWYKTAQGSREVRNKTLGILGYGRIGTQVGILAESMGMQVLYFDIKDVLPIGNVKSVKTLKQLLSLSDFVTIHVPETQLTKNMIQSHQLKWMKKGAFLINMSRGSVVSMTDLKDALNEKHLSGAAIDVFPKEPDKKDSAFTTELQGMKQVILSPHIAGSTEEAQENIAKQVSKSLINFLFHGISEGAVNFPILNPPPLEELDLIKG